MSALLTIENLEVRYGSICAVKNVSFQVPEKSIVTLIGGNGAGKTTTLKAISGLLKPTHGNITYLGQSILSVPAHTLVTRGLSHCPEGRGVFSTLTVRENLEMGGFTASRAQKQRNFDRALRLFPRLQERLKQKAGTLSGGEQQMLAIGRSLMTDPKLLLLDEPSLGLAPQVVQTIFRIIREIRAQGTTVLLVEQNARMALQIADQAHVLETGVLTQSGEGVALLKDSNVQKAYLGVV